MELQPNSLKVFEVQVLWPSTTILVEELPLKVQGTGSVSKQKAAKTKQTNRLLGFWSPFKPLTKKGPLVLESCFWFPFKPSPGPPKSKTQRLGASGLGFLRPHAPRARERGACSGLGESGGWRAWSPGFRTPIHSLAEMAQTKFSNCF